MLLEMCQLGELFATDVALEWALPGVRPHVNLEIRELTKGLVALFTCVASLPVLLLLDILKKICIIGILLTLDYPLSISQYRSYSSHFLSFSD